jgi:hypothetical protein
LNIQRIMMAAMTGATISGRQDDGLHQPASRKFPVEQQRDQQAPQSGSSRRWRT